MWCFIGDDKDRERVRLQQTRIDNGIFSLHYKVTVIILVTLSFVITTKQYAGNPINCITSKHSGSNDYEVPLEVMDAYCWIYSTFTLPNKLNGRIGKHVPPPAVGSHGGVDEVKYHKYYQWVCLVLVVQAVFFYMPRYLWRTWEAGLMYWLSLKWMDPAKTEDEQHERIMLQVGYFKTNLGRHKFYITHFMICEVLSLVNVIVQCYLVDYFLDGEFRMYGWDVIKFTEISQENRIDPMVRIFPKITACTFRKYGPSGSIEKVDALCVLTLNVFHEKIYLFLWFWFILLIFLTGLCIIYRIITAMCPMLRMYLLRTEFRIASQKDIQIIADKFQLGDWFVIYQLGKNMDQLKFELMISTLAEQLSDKKKRTFDI